MTNATDLVLVSLVRGHGTFRSTSPTLFLSLKLRCLVDGTRSQLEMSVVNLGIDHDSDEVVALKATISNKGAHHLIPVP